MFNLVLSLVIAVSGVWVFLDATKNDIGKIEGEKGFFNLHAGGWAIVTLLLWIVGFPAYLIKRKSLIEKAYVNPIYASKRWLKVVGLAVIGLLLVAGPLAALLSQLEPSLLQQYEGVYKNKVGRVTEVRLTGDNTGVFSDKIQTPITVQSIDTENNTISIMMNTPEEDLAFTIKGEFDNSNNLTLRFTAQNGQSFDLFFVKKFDNSSSPIPSAAKNDISCTNADVKRYVLERTYEALSAKLLPSYILGNSEALMAELGPYVDDSENNSQVESLSLLLLFTEGEISEDTLDYFLKFSKTSPTAANILETMAQQIKDMGNSLDGIRILKKQTDIKKISCAADIKSNNGDKHPITYSAQATEDDQVYVEVRGL